MSIAIIAPSTELTVGLLFRRESIQKAVEAVCWRVDPHLSRLNLVLGVIPLDRHRPRGVLEVLRVVLLEPLPNALLRDTTKEWTMQRVASCGGHFSHDYLHYITLGDPPESTGPCLGLVGCSRFSVYPFRNRGKDSKAVA